MKIVAEETCFGKSKKGVEYSVWRIMPSKAGFALRPADNHGGGLDFLQKKPDEWCKNHLKLMSYNTNLNVRPTFNKNKDLVSILLTFYEKSDAFCVRNHIIKSIKDALEAFAVKR